MLLRGGRLGPLHERAFRAYFLGGTVSALGDAVAQVALAFAVIRYGSVTELGIILAGRQLASSVALLVGGVVGDRLPRAQVLVAAAVVQGLAQGGSACWCSPAPRRSRSCYRCRSCSVSPTASSSRSRPGSCRR